jgi:hypothetical protein
MALAQCLCQAKNILATIDVTGVGEAGWRLAASAGALEPGRVFGVSDSSKGRIVLGRGK